MSSNERFIETLAQVDDTQVDGTQVDGTQVETQVETQVDAQVTQMKETGGSALTIVESDDDSESEDESPCEEPSSLKRKLAEEEEVKEVKEISPPPLQRRYIRKDIKANIPFDANLSRPFPTEILPEFKVNHKLESGEFERHYQWTIVNTQRIFGGYALLMNRQGQKVAKVHCDGKIIQLTAYHPYHEQSFAIQRTVPTTKEPYTFAYQKRFLQEDIQRAIRVLLSTELNTYYSPPLCE